MSHAQDVRESSMVLLSALKSGIMEYKEDDIGFDVLLDCSNEATGPFVRVTELHVLNPESLFALQRTLQMTIQAVNVLLSWKRGVSDPTPTVPPPAVGP